MTITQPKRQSIARYWGVRLICSVISLASFYVAAVNPGLSILALLPVGLYLGVYGFFGRDILNQLEYCDR